MCMMAKQTWFDTCCNGVFHRLNIYLPFYFEDSMGTKKKKKKLHPPPQKTTNKQTNKWNQAKHPSNKIRLEKKNDCSSLCLATGRYILFYGNEHHKYVCFDNSMHVTKYLVAQQKIDITEGPKNRKILTVSIFWFRNIVSSVWNSQSSTRIFFSYFSTYDLRLLFISKTMSLSLSTVR